MYSKDEIIKGMCVTYRHDYGLLPEDEQEAILIQMNQLFEHDFKPVLYHISNLIDATAGQARVTGKESIRVRVARKRAQEFLDSLALGK